MSFIEYFILGLMVFTFYIIKIYIVSNFNIKKYDTIIGLSFVLFSTWVGSILGSSINMYIKNFISLYNNKPKVFIDLLTILSNNYSCLLIDVVLIIIATIFNIIIFKILKKYIQK